MKYRYLLLFPVFLVHAYILNPRWRKAIKEKLDREQADAKWMEKQEESYDEFSRIDRSSDAHFSM